MAEESCESFPAHERLAQIVSLLGGGAALAMMTGSAGAAILKQWYFYPSFLLFVGIALHFLNWLPWKGGRLLWRMVQWWSGFWGCLFLSIFLAPPFSFLAVGPLMEGIIGSSGVNPFLAGFFHLVMWGCARDMLEDGPANPGEAEE